MAKKRSRAKRKTKRSSKRPGVAAQIAKIFLTLGLLVLLVVLAGVLAYYLLQTPNRPSVATGPPEVRMPIPPVKVPSKPTYEVYPPKDVPAKPLDKMAVSGQHGKPLVAIIVDDMGYDRPIAAHFFSMDAPFTFSILPFGPFSTQIAAEARAKGYELMLHLPMEPNEYPQVDPGPGALISDMSPDELIAQLNMNLGMVPGLKGVNNHMGSRLSASSEHMRQVFTILKKQGLYYIDSRTSAQTVGRSSAKLLHVPFAERDIFIDHFDDPAFIRKQLRSLIARAKKQGYAVGIAHPHDYTYEILNEFMPRLKKEVELVSASVVVQAVMYAEANGKSTDR
jgi:polysaccharide deacetylase 2 family uncharacterized protein YibQ